MTWSSATPSVAVISNAAGSSTITAGLGAISATALLSVTSVTLSSIAINPPAFTLARGQPRQLTATATFSDLSTLEVTSQVTWSSSSFVAQVNSTGLVSASSFSGGSAVLTAARGPLSGASSVTVP